MKGEKRKKRATILKAVSSSCPQPIRLAGISLRADFSAGQDDFA